MDCLEFRRMLAVTPRSNDPALHAHWRKCPACADAWERARQFEEELEQALQTPVPEHLVEQMLRIPVTSQYSRPSRRLGHGRRAAMALAASIVFVLGFAGAAWQQFDARSLATLAVAHMPPEITSLDLTRPLTTQAVAAGFAGRNLVLHGPVPTGTTYVHDCIVGPYKAVHMVTRRDGEPVVVLYLPHKHVKRVRDFNRYGWIGREMPMGDGSLVLLTNRGNRAPFKSVASAWHRAIMGQHDSATRQSPLPS